MKTAEQVLRENMGAWSFPDFETSINAMHEYANQQTKESLSTIRSLAIQLDRKGANSLIEEIDKMINEL